MIVEIWNSLPKQIADAGTLIIFNMRGIDTVNAESFTWGSGIKNHIYAK